MGRLRLHIQRKKMMNMPSKCHRVLFSGNGDFVICDLIRKADVNGDNPEKVVILAHDLQKAKHDPFHTGYHITYTYRHKVDKFPVFDENNNDVVLNQDDLIVFDLTENLA